MRLSPYIFLYINIGFLSVFPVLSNNSTLYLCDYYIKLRPVSAGSHELKSCKTTPESAIDSFINHMLFS